MSLKVSVKDIRFTKPFFLYLNVFSITPWYDFNTNLFCRPTISKIYGCILLFAKFLWFITALMNTTVRRTFVESLFSVKIVLVFGGITLLMRTILIILKSTTWNVSDWKTLLVNFNIIDANLQTTKRKEAFFKNFYLQLGIKHLLFGIFVGHQFYSWAKFFDFSWLESLWMSPIVEFYEEFLVMVLMHALVESIKVRYRKLNSRLVEVCQNSETNKMDQELSNLSHVYRTLGDNIDAFNSIFGCQILVTLFHWGLQMILCLNYLFVVVVGVDDDLYRNFMIGNIFTLFFIKVRTIFNFLLMICNVLVQLLHDYLFD